MRNFNGELAFHPQIPKEWKSYSFKINFRGNTIKVYKDHKGSKFSNESGTPVEIVVNGKKIIVNSEELVVV